MHLDIQTGLQAAILAAFIGFFLALMAGIRRIKAGRNLLYYKKRQEMVSRGWKTILAALLLIVLGFSLRRYGAPVAYQFFPPSPTVTNTPTITMTPTITETPTITLTPTITETPSITNTPAMPPEIAAQIQATITPNPAFVFSRVLFATKIDDGLQPVDPQTEFTNPITILYGTFSYTDMTINANWAAIWVRMADNKIMCVESMPWTSGSGGYGYTECEPAGEQWLPGEYEVQMFVGQEWANSGKFTITGDAPAPLPSATNTRTASPTWTMTVPPTQTPTPPNTPTRAPTRTYPPTATPWPTNTRAPTATY